MKEELIKIIDELSEVLEEETLKISDFELMDLALRLYNTEQINKSKDYPRQFNSFNKIAGREPFTKPKENIKNEEPKKDFEPITKEQEKFMRKVGLTIPTGASKKDCWRIIKEFKERQ